MAWDDDKKSVTDKLEAISKTVESLSKQGQGQEDLVQTFKQEIGDVRTKLDELGTSSLDAEKVKDLVDKIDKIGDTIKIGKKPDDKGGTDDDKDWDEAKLTEEAKAKADEVYKSLTPEQKAHIANNPDERKKFLKTAQEATSTVPDSLFSKPADEGNEAHKFRKLFNLNERESGHVPSTSSSGSEFAGASTGLDKGADTQATKRLPNGAIPRGNRPKQGDKS